MFKNFIFSLVLTAQIIASHHTIYWDTPAYTNQKIPEQRYVYHKKPFNMVGDILIPLNQMPYSEKHQDTYHQAIKKYEGREQLLETIIPTLNCLWNDVIYLSPLHPHHQYAAYKKIGFTMKSIKFYKIPVEMLFEKKVTVFKYLDYPDNDPIHDSLESYCDLPAHYQELKEVPAATLDYYKSIYNPENPTSTPPLAWYLIPHVMLQDTIDVSDPRVTVIDWQDPI